MASILLENILINNNIDPKDVMLIRHVKSNEEFSKCLEKGYIKEYTSLQTNNFAKGCKYWMVFISDKNTYARYYKIYKVGSSQPRNISQMPSGYPCPEHYKETNRSNYELEDTDFLADLQGRLVIEWGNNARNWFQTATTSKEVISLHSAEFTGYENVVLSFEKLKTIVNNPKMYDDYYSALSKIKAVYLITDRKNGKHYVGSAYGSDGLFGRWSSYIKTHDGGNKKITAYLKQNPNGYMDFQFSILQIFSMHATQQEIEAVEYLYMKKLLSVDFGYN